ncbi:hypothetical protein HELRODRAFT_169963 [Helobdella robusta]|uniref:Tetraspanin n=1 Tax=Helobdella robusta TaxID=6412 RepID=T1F2H6_HELRO|nr:hypothetical protein HELRODRAFT_169963 [Helobdella robusta]ESO08224.1 hypothetical protein HELRODRAFT_169963 [Helobdella robusta]
MNHPHRDAMKEELKRKELEQNLISAEDRLDEVGRNEVDRSEQIWQSVFFLNLFMIFLCPSGAFLITFEHSKVYDSLTLLDNYDDGSFFTLMLVVCIICCMVNIMGALITWVAINKARRGRMRYMIYAFVAWMAACIIILGTTLVQIFALFLSLATMFKDGFAMNMMLYGRVPEIAHKIHDFQIEGKCCGSFNYTEWFAITWSNIISKTTLNLPVSCCDLGNYTIDECIMESRFDRPQDLTVSNRGCVNTLEWYFKYILILSVCTMVTMFFMEFVIFMMSLINLPSIKSYENLLIEERIRMMMKRLAVHRQLTGADEEEENKDDLAD